MARDLSAGGRAGVVVFAASKGRQPSFESGTARGLVLSNDVGGLPAYPARSGHGYFTAAVLDSLASPATDLDGDGRIELTELVQDVTFRVARASDWAQTPWVARREMFGDFAIAGR
jgi:hypothetical protein